MSTFRDILDTISGLEGEVTDYVANTKKQHSLSKTAMEGILNFPVIVSNSLTIEDASLVSKALEREFASFVLVSMTMNPYLYTSNKSASAADYINKFHQNLDTKTNATDIINAATKIAREAATMSDVDYETLDGLEETIAYKIYEGVNYPNINKENIRVSYTLEDVTNSKIVNESVNRRISGINRPVMEGPYTRYGNTHTDFDSYDFSSRYDTNRVRAEQTEDAHNQRVAQMNRQMDKWEYDENYQAQRDRVQDSQWGRQFGAQRAKDLRDFKFRQSQFEYDKQRDRANDARQSRLDDEQQKRFEAEMSQKFRDQRQLQHMMDNDAKKANELVPTLLHMRVYPIDKEKQVELPPIDFVLGIKATLHPVSSDEMITNVCRGIKNENTFFNFLRWTTGETRFLKDFVFGMNELKIDAVNSSAKASKWWSMLKRRKAMTKIKNVILPNKLLPNATIVITQEEVDTIKDIYGYDLNNTSLVYKLMENYFLISFVIVDPALQRVKFLFDGRTQYETLTYATLAREATTNDKQFKEMLNMLGRRI